MSKNIKILETKLKQFVGEGFEVKDLKVVTNEVELDLSIKTKTSSSYSEKHTHPKMGGGLGRDKKEVLSSNKKILFFSSDEASVKNMKQVKRIIDWMIKARYISIDIVEHLDLEVSDKNCGCSITGQTLTEILNSLVVCLRQSFELVEDAYLLETAIHNVLESGLQTSDMIESEMTPVSCEQFCTAVITELKLMEQGFCLE